MEIQTQIDIDSPPERVWAVLTDFTQYPAWNPFIRSIQGDARVGGRLHVTLGAADEKRMAFRPVVTGMEHARFLLAWRGTLIARWLFTGEHKFSLEVLTSGRTRFHHGESFSGLLVPFLRKSLDTTTRLWFELMNEALKQASERVGV